MMAYGIAFDIDTNCYKDFIREKFPELDETEALIKATSRLTHVYKEIEDAMYRAGFIRLQGSVYRILLDAKIYDSHMVEKGLSKALSIGEEPVDSAYWIQGFLKGSVTILLLDAVVWNILYLWMESLDEEIFDSLLPLLRRTFSKFSAYERAKIGTKAKEGIDRNETIEVEDLSSLNFDQDRALKALILTKERLYGE